MSHRKTIRPITLKRIIQVCSLACKEKTVDTKRISKELNLSLDRSREIVLELKLIALLTADENGYYKSNNNTEQFLEDFQSNNWKKLHQYFYSNYHFYKDYIDILVSNNSEMGLTIAEIRESSEKQNLSLNQTAVEVLSDWCERLGVIQRHLFGRRIYQVDENNPLNSLQFKATLQGYYNAYCASHRKWGIFLEIPALREDLCEKMRLRRQIFDEMLKTLFLENIGRMEISGAPINTSAKQSPLSEKKMKVKEENALLTPKFEACKQREGLLVGKKAYYYVSIYECL